MSRGLLGENGGAVAEAGSGIAADLESVVDVAEASGEGSEGVGRGFFGFAVSGGTRGVAWMIE